MISLLLSPTQQASLFGDAEPAFGKIAGLHYVADFIPPSEEASLVAIIDRQPWLTGLKRRVQHYGWKYDYTARRVHESMRLGTLPDWLATYCRKLHEGGYFSTLPDQVIVNEYLPGQGITPHVDCVPCFGDTIASISLGSACIMEFSKGMEKIPVWLEPRSLVILTGDARYGWKHAIPQRKTDMHSGGRHTRNRRLSLTFRTVK